MAAEDLLTNKNRAGIGHVTKTYFCNLQCVSSPPNTMSRIPINGVSLDVIYHKDFIGMLGSIIHGFSSISSPLLCRGRIWDMSLADTSICIHYAAFVCNFGTGRYPHLADTCSAAAWPALPSRKLYQAKHQRTLQC